MKTAAPTPYALHEAAVLASIVENASGQLPPVMTRLLKHAPESFDDMRLGKVAVAVRELLAAGKPCHALTLAEAGFSIVDVSRLLDSSLPIELAEAEAETVWAGFQRRKVIALLGEACEAAQQHPDKAESIARNVADGLRELTGAGDDLSICDAANFLAETITPPAEVVCGILHRGSKGALGGGSKSYKTWLLLHLAIAVATGEPFLSFKTARGRVLYCNLEIQPAFFRARLDVIAKALGVVLAPGQLDVLNLRGRCSTYDTLLPRISARAKQGNYVLIVLDPIYKLYSGTDENSAGDVARLLNALEMLAVETGAAVCYGAHYAKGNAAAKDAIDRVSGSGVFARDPDSLLNFTRHEEPEAFTVEATLRNFKPVEPFVVRWQYPLMRRAEELDPARLKKPAGRKPEHDPEEILTTLSGDGMSLSDWESAAKDEYGVYGSTFHRLRRTLEKTGKVLKDKGTRKWKVATTTP